MFKIGAKIQWKWLGRPILGVVKEVHTEKITRTIKGKQIVRKGSKENPAYVVESEAGNTALKLGSELTAAPKTSKKKSIPKMFT